MQGHYKTCEDIINVILKVFYILNYNDLLKTAGFSWIFILLNIKINLKWLRNDDSLGPPEWSESFIVEFLEILDRSK